MIKSLLNTFLSVILTFCVYSQDFNYVHYDTKDGLASSTVYDLCQDKQGFIWFATEYGVSRFDGSHFKNFTVKDGLPENEVVRVYADKKGRVWIASFSREISYYYNNRIYNSGNDSTLKKLRFKKNVYNIVEDFDGDIMFSDNSRIIELKANNEVIIITDLPAFKNVKWEIMGVGGNYVEGDFDFHNIDSGFSLTDNGLVFKKLYATDNFYKQAVIRVLPDGKNVLLKTPANITTFTIFPFTHTLYMINTLSGTWTFDSITNKLKDNFLPGRMVSRSMTDIEGNIWLATLGEGAFKLPSRNIRSITTNKGEEKNKSEIFSIARVGDRIIAGMGFSKAMILKDGKLEKTKNYKEFLETIYNSNEYNRIYAMETLSSGELVLGFDHFLLKESGEKKIFNELRPIKAIEQIDQKHILVGTHSYVLKLQLKDMKVIDTVWSGRSTKLFYNNNKYYIGYINGLIEMDADEMHGSRSLGDLHPALSRRINDIIITADGVMWIATNDQGIVAYKSGKVIHVINEARGLSSNICKTLFLKDNFLWVGTNKGLNKINLNIKTFPILKYSTSDGLPSNIINAVYVEDSTIWMGTPAGMVYFNENAISNTSICRLIMEQIKISGIAQDPDTRYSLKYNNRNISFEYTAISFKSGGEIIYRYRMTGLDSGWKETRFTELDYQSLPPGNYELQLYAVNKFGVKSNTITIPVTVAAPFWRKWWFYVLGSVIIIGTTLFLMSRRYRRVRKRLEEKNAFEKQVAGVEQQALQAQMNPHFIFNCLNSIQQYIITRDSIKANKYLTEFAALIRLTLDHSGKKTITIAEEVEYLTRYLQMEKMRFGDNFNYKINISEDIDPDKMEIPAMLLQPYVENCLRHGIRYKRSEQGKVEILFFMSEDHLTCTITDNGIGRKKATELKSHQHIEYQSKGMELTEKRISLLNKITNRNITVEVIDLYDTDDQASGTKVIIKFPVI